jgi:hypothetical protein
LGYYCLVDGVLKVDGNLISEINEEQIWEQAEIIKAKGIKNIVINGVFSPVDVIYKQEESSGEIMKQVPLEVNIVISKNVADLGFLEREMRLFSTHRFCRLRERQSHHFAVLSHDFNSGVWSSLLKMMEQYWRYND